MKTNHLRLPGLVLALALAAIAMAPHPAYAFSCKAGNPYDDFWYFYTDATFTTLVGECENDCGVCHCSGTQTQYPRVYTRSCGT